MISAHIFRAYDIRGVYDKDLTPEAVKKIAKALGNFVGERERIVVGRDGRLSGDTLKDSVVKGIIASGNDVIDVGMVPTPLLYFASISLRAQAGVMITASHNPPDWNGLKLVRENGQFIFEGSGMEKIRENVLANNLFESPQKGKVETYEIFKDYSKFVLSKIDVKRKLRVVLDTANGVAGLIAPQLFRKLGCEVIVLNEKVDGRFPAHLPEPNEETLQELSKEVVKQKADFGAGFDGDGDRIIFVDDRGRIITSGSTMIILFAGEYLKKYPNSKVVFDICCSDVVKEFIHAANGIPIITKVGHVFIKDKMLKENAIFGGEYSNHLYFSEVFCFDDGIFAGLKMAEILSKQEKKLSELIDEVPKYFNKFDWNFSCPDEKKFGVIEKLKQKFLKEGLRLSELDGVKLFFKDGWILWRASNTQPQIKVYVEARSKEKFKELCDYAQKELENAMG
ncbi:MAG: phosphomannomutase/phosphoglucomutase [Candidatus Aenigmarchaeota archaeon]|nr:phosphomannomutase/phosphoglucomutase [Candidatus Aenigmarchaeota archaeon]